MHNNLSAETPFNKALQLVSLLLVLFGFVLLGSVVFMQSMQFFLGTSFTSTASLFEILKSLPPNNYLLIAQMLTALTSFIFLPFLYAKYFLKELLESIKFSIAATPVLSLLAIGISLMSFPLIGYLALINKEIISMLPAMDQLLPWMEKSEADAKQLTELMVYFHTPLQSLLALLVIAILPAVGEEFLFRGIIQNRLKTIFGNPHAAIWLTGFLFSFIHFQFFGFIPRMFLGVLFGYIYYWSGNLWLPILMHFTNNSFTLLVVNWQKNRGVADALDTEQQAPISVIIICSAILIWLIWNFVNKCKTNYGSSIT